MWKIRKFIVCIGLIGIMLVACTKVDSPTKEADKDVFVIDTAKWHGFNLNSKILVGEWAPDDTEEWAFEFMQEYGFNFARIPIEYNNLFEDETYKSFNEKAFKEIDQIIERGDQYNVHILLDLHSLPGTTAGEPLGEENVWNSEEYAALWVRIFEKIAGRYEDIEPSKLSFNLLNEPHDVDEDNYLSKIQAVYSAIRAIDKDRPIFIDGLEWSTIPINALDVFNDPNIVASPHFYQPFMVTHYKADWVNEAEFYPLPFYPSPIVPRYLYGSYEEPLNHPLIIHGNFGAGTVIRFHVAIVSNLAQFRINSDQELLLSEDFQAGPGEGEWKESIYNEEWDIYQNVYDRVYEATLTKDASLLIFGIEAGDWLSFENIEIEGPNEQKSISINASSYDWGVVQTDIYINNVGQIDENKTKNMINQQFLEESYFKCWEEYRDATGIEIMPCEFGVYSYTPHDVALAVLEDNLKLFEKNKWGYALWNLGDDFGIIDSDREDVEYKDWKGHKLDVEMLELLLKYK